MKQALQNEWNKYNKYVILFLIVLFLPFMAVAQYFGWNKVNYRKLDFEVLQTPHFDIYHYLNNKDNLNRFSQQTEQWYRMYQAVFNPDCS